MSNINLTNWTSINWFGLVLFMIWLIWLTLSLFWRNKFFRCLIWSQLTIIVNSTCLVFVWIPCIKLFSQRLIIVVLFLISYQPCKFKITIVTVITIAIILSHWWWYVTHWVSYSETHLTFGSTYCSIINQIILQGSKFVVFILV